MREIVITKLDLMDVYENILIQISTIVAIYMSFRSRWTLRSLEDIVLNMGKKETVRRQRGL